MLTCLGTNRSRDCEGTSRRDFLKVGGLGLGAMALPQLLQSRAQAAQAGKEVKDTSVIWVWLSGGATHVETFDPKLTAPSEYHSVTGEVKTNLPGVTIGGNFHKLAQQADKMAFVRSFAHTNSGHGGGTHFVMTGYDNRNIDNGGLPTRPSMGSIVSKIRGANHAVTGMPTYISLNNIGADGPAFLGTAYAPFTTSSNGRRNMALSTTTDRIADRRGLLEDFDRFQRDADRTGLMSGLDAFEQQAFNLILGNAPQAFDVKEESQKTRDKYGKDLGEQMLVARRLVESGCGFVTLNYGGWDMHGTIERAMNQRAPSLDRALAALIEDLSERGMLDRTLVVVSGEFGRTPRINKNAGRDHWAPLSTLAMAGGGLRMGQVVGESDSKLYRPQSEPIRPQDLMATVFHVLGIDTKQQFFNQAGRPVFLIEDGKPIKELV